MAEVKQQPPVSNKPTVSAVPTASNVQPVSNKPTVSAVPTASNVQPVSNKPTVSAVPTASNVPAASNIPSVSTIEMVEEGEDEGEGDDEEGEVEVPTSPPQLENKTVLCAPPPEEEAMGPDPSLLLEQEAERKRTAYPIIRHTDVPEENKADILDTILAAVDRFPLDYDLACRQIKEDMDRTYGPHWHAIIGESFGYEVTHQNHHIMYLFYMGNLGILVWKNN